MAKLHFVGLQEIRAKQAGHFKMGAVDLYSGAAANGLYGAAIVMSSSLPYATLGKGESACLDPACLQVIHVEARYHGDYFEGLSKAGHDWSLGGALGAFEAF